ncbi:hypothetical protein ACIBK8_25770 [Streptomyces sp. NPDC050161]|uniref:hypothetical protein n=1 Tax=Streptomyces sp. NPDC050161 TaxID=3365604 RepID=UPI0037AB28BF
MNPDIQRELIPRGDTLRLIEALDGMKAKFVDAAGQWQLLDDAGHVPSSPAYAELIQHAADAQALCGDIVQLTAEFARTAHSTNRDGSAVLAHLATAVTMSGFAAPYFAETAESALALPRASGPIDRQYLENRMVLNHGTARAYLRRTSESLRDAVRELHSHLEFHRFFPTPSRQETPAPPPPGPSGRHR